MWQGLFSVLVNDSNVAWVLVLLIVVMVIVTEYWTYKLHKTAMDERRREIDRVANENREYREIFLQLIKRETGFTSDAGNETTMNQNQTDNRE